MKLHEYQAKEILKRFDLPIPRGSVAFSPEEAKRIASDLKASSMVVKAQIYAGGRGKAGGIRQAQSPEEVEEITRRLLGTTLVTPQTGPEGKPVNALLIEEALEVERELYVGLVIERSLSLPVLMVSEAGGMEIEEVAKAWPEKIKVEKLDPYLGLLSYQARNLALSLGLKGSLLQKGAQIMTGLWRAFRECDCSLAEVNPLVVTKQGEVLCLDAKLNLDDSGLYRHKDLEALRDKSQEDHLEIEASQYGLSYIKLDGEVGCMVNGAGLAMATMDLIKMAGSEPANFLDVGGGASAQQVMNAFKILLADKKVKAVLINIFGGILRCERVAQGIIEALKQVEVKVPVVVRLEGTNYEEGRRLLQESQLNFSVATGLKDAADKVAMALRGNR